jgi:hypothetical protein
VFWVISVYSNIRNTLPKSWHIPPGTPCVCMPGVFHATEKDNAARVCDSVAVVFVLLWKLKFLAYLLNVTKRFVIRIISYSNVVYFIQLAMDGR